MQIYVNVDEEVINESAEQIIVSHVVKEVENKMFNDTGRYEFIHNQYKKYVQAELRKMIKEHSDDIINRAIYEASKIIAKKGLSKLLESNMKEISDD